MIEDAFPAAMHDDIVAHMNEDHGDAVLAMARAFGGRRDVSGARLVTITPSWLGIEADGDSISVLMCPPIAPLDTVRQRLVDATRSARELLEAPALHARWLATPDALSTRYTFERFADAIRFMNACVPDIDALDHHPDWRNSYKRVDVTLTTHSKGRVTGLDAKLAAAMDGWYAADEH